MEMAMMVVVLVIVALVAVCFGVDSRRFP